MFYLYCNNSLNEIHKSVKTCISFGSVWNIVVIKYSRFILSSHLLN